MKARIVKIGNSQGVRIPKPILKQTGLRGEVEIEVDGDKLIIAPIGRPRAGWSAAFAEMAAAGDDSLLDDLPSASGWDDDEWHWK